MKKIDFASIYQETVLAKVTLPNKLKTDFILEACLKQSQHSMVFLMRSLIDKKKYILKQADYKERYLLLAEYTQTAHIQHTNLPIIHDFFDEGEYSYLYREYVEGYTLSEMVENKGPLEEMEAIKTVSAISKIIGHLHGLTPPIIHRDIKAQNIIKTPENEYRVIDLETARSFKKEAEGDTVFMGTKETAAPEQFGYMQTDRRSDIYGLGMLLLYLCTGSYSRDKKNLRNISRRTRRIILKATAFDPSKRYKKIIKLQQALYRRKKRRVINLTIIAMLFSIIGTLSFMSMNVKEHMTSIVKFREPLIEEAIRLELGVDKFTPIYYEDLSEISQVLICGENIMNDWNDHRQYCKSHYINNNYTDSVGKITSLDDLSNLPNLKWLILDNQQINEIDNLKGLPLEKLSISGNMINDLSPLKGSVSLREIWLEENQVATLEPLGDIEQLQTLNISYNPVSSLDDISQLKVVKLYMNDTLVRDFEFLRTMPLKKLCISNISDKGRKIICNKNDLTWLTVYNSNLREINDLFALTNLEYLDVFGNNISDVTGVTQLTNLRHLGIGQNPVTDITYLKDLPNLQSIDIEACPIDDLEALLEIRVLEYVHTDMEKKAALRALFENENVIIGP